MVEGIKAIDPKIRICGYGHLGDGNLHFNLVQAAGGDPDFDAKTPGYMICSMEILPNIKAPLVRSTELVS